jgi:hypothetical protein
LDLLDLLSNNYISPIMLISTRVYTHALGYCAITTTRRRKGRRTVTKFSVTDWIVLLLVWDNGRQNRLISNRTDLDSMKNIRDESRNIALIV